MTRAKRTRATTRIVIGLSAGAARRRGRRLLREKIRNRVRRGDQLKIQRANQGKDCVDRREVELLQGRCKFLFRLGTFPFGNGLAKAAPMFAVERFLDRFRERDGGQVSREHAGPCNRLQNAPMRTCRSQDSNHH